MSRFRFDQYPCCKPILGRPKELQLSEDWYFFVDGRKIWAPKGYRFETSIPWCFRWLIGEPTDPQFWAAACAHDWCFETHCLGFEEANDLFFAFLGDFKVGDVKRKFMTFAVSTRIGRKAYEKVVISELQELKAILDLRPDRSKFLEMILVSEWGLI